MTQYKPVPFGMKGLTDYRLALRVREERLLVVMNDPMRATRQAARELRDVQRALMTDQPEKE